jgi:hypothetical protein
VGAADCPHGAGLAEEKAPMKLPNVMQEPPDFSLVLGGPLYQLFRRAHLSGSTLELLQRRIVILTLLAWLPLCILAALRGRLLGGSVAVPFLLDVEVHARFLVALPLLIVAELVVHRRLRPVVQQFLDRHVIPDGATKRFDAALASAFRLRDSLLAEVLLIALVYGVLVLLVWRQYVVLPVSSWYSVPTIAGPELTLAGMWYGYVSMPIFQFMLLRWYFRLFIWMRFLWHVSRIDLSLLPTHPDRVGGVGFLSGMAFAFLPLATAHGAVLAGFIANRIFHAGAMLPEFKIEIAVVVAFLQCVVFGPLLVFAGQLAQARRTGLREYGTLAARYVRDFDAKWLRGGAAADEPLVGSADIQSLADLGNSIEVVQGMHIAPVSRRAVIQLAVATLLPLAPLLLTMMPLEELLQKLVGMLL